MATGRKSDFTLPTFDSIFSTQEQRDDAKLAKIRDIPISEIDDFPDHPFKVRDDEDMLQLVESIKERGVITPASHIKVLDIRQEAEKKISFYREQIIAKVNKKSLIHSDQTVNKQLQQVQDQFKDYQLSLYLLAFSSFLEVMLIENFDKDYLNGITEKLENYSLKYRELYTQCYEEISGYSSSSVQSALLKGISKTSTVMGKMIEKIPVVSNSQADETLIAAGDKLQKIGDDKVRKQMKALIERQSNYVRPFIDNINTVNELHNNPVQLLVDKENLYIDTIA